jgi:hypothetical protein
MRAIEFKDLIPGKRYKVLQRSWSVNDWSISVSITVLGEFISKLDGPDWCDGLCIFKKSDGTSIKHRHREIHIYGEIMGSEPIEDKIIIKI